MHYPTLYAFLLATAVPAATSLAIRSGNQQESASSLIMDIVRRSNQESDEATFARLKRTQVDLEGQGGDSQGVADPYSLERRGENASEGRGFTQADLKSVLASDLHPTPQAGIKRRRRRAIQAFVRRGTHIPSGNPLNRDTRPIAITHEEKRSLLGGSGTTGVIGAEESDEDSVDDDGEEDDDMEYDERKRLTRRGISAMIARRRVKRSLSQ
ncbi:hypothetical protein MGG_05108 [Pyricularia oryzae 70-15]|uniref:Uncharacterized protein n=3 Tax=Pyricularia oryzae TaxID=318829 RepID=G4N4F6_PYRO7|nr:uncharacterized protein MGG_05108 [Pyricularia oryzae 70-15]EHA52824.1 hypothetical protein MGG_05108 [Pyricularia oryzae 70-15]ELQ39277.1 hypothetical protein OOU_Y34scaffold00510g16 [Pyricularia oryzae Y34]KAI7918965.1 hypothetical protein M0657_007351 [Pyricularia oryzae]KAI7930642.1 hypothetical protein M9X92_000706 [Pyricularia oryzae]